MASPPLRNPIESGMNQAAARLQPYEIVLPAADALQPTIEIANRLLLEVGAVSMPAAELFFESVVIAAAVRVTYDEPVLTVDEIGHYLEVSRAFFNSLWHV